MMMPEKRCDLVMKGGVTSGVVYPLAVVNLAKDYRFDNVGGTSAGAISAAVTAAAEYGRSSGGFDKVGGLPEELAGSLMKKFQPLPVFRPLFGLAMAAIGGSKGAMLKALLVGYGVATMLGALPGIIIVVGGLVAGSLGFILLGLLLALLGALLNAARVVLRQVKVDLPRHDYGMCSGLTQCEPNNPALTDWLTDTIDNMAGRPIDGRPLTVRDLQESDHPVNLTTVTTDLTTRRPYALPMDNNLHFFSEAEFRGLFPKRVVDHMVATSNQVMATTTGQPIGDLRYFKNDDLPVVVLARMSLSFPFLFSAVPLHRFDYSFAEEHRMTPVRCLFSDGGISSNFPVHFFDRFLPNTPTFGFSLAEFDPRRLRKGQDMAADQTRIHLPTKAGDGRHLPTREINGTGSFVMAMFDSAKDWQDSLQSILPGYRERIVTIALTGDEGGLNLDMDAEIVRHLTNLGGLAGDRLRQTFCLDEHRWRRFLVELRALEKALVTFARHYSQAPQPGATGYSKLITEYKGATCPQLSELECAFQSLSGSFRVDLKTRAELIAGLGKSLMQKKSLDQAKGLPASRSDLRNVASMGDDVVLRG